MSLFTVYITVCYRNSFIVSFFVDSDSHDQDSVTLIATTRIDWIEEPM